mmetsp:Transcript_7631/g.6911  ORF Transcript_7631/g.6911 Transcript_7631/m.6911 type:complete len:271 (+) Transcript_7631:1554-2366(+)
MMIVAYFIIKTAPLLIKKAWIGVEKDKLNVFAYVFRFLLSGFYLLSNPFVLYYAIYGVTAVIGLTISPFFFAFHLLDVLVRYSILNDVIKSVTIPWKPFLLTFILYLVYDYFFALIGYYFFVDDFNGYCSSTWFCFLASFDFAFKADGGVGGWLAETSTTSLDIGRFLYDNIYNFLMLIIMLNIVAGIIIDTFGTLRDEDKNYHHDIENICFICGYDRETLDKASDVKNGFLNHIKKDHYLWNYLFYIAYIQQKKATDLTGLESYISQQV